MVGSICSAGGGNGLQHFAGEVTTETNPSQRTQLVLVAFVVVLYLSCQTSLIYLAKSIRSAVEYSDDPSVLANSTSAGIKSYVDYLEKFCEAGSETNGRFENTSRNTNSSRFQEQRDLGSHVLRVIRKRANNRVCREDSLSCEVVAFCYACDSKSDLIGYKYQINASEFTVTDLNSTGEANSYTELTTFVDASLEYDIVISYGVRQSNSAEKKSFLRLLITGLKIAIPVPIATTLLVYGYLPQLRNLQGKIIVCKLVCEFVNSVSPWFVDDDEPRLVFVCSCVAGITWSTILCYDLWSSFSGCLPASRRPGHGRRFARYSLIGWGHPALFGLVVFCAKRHIENDVHLVIIMYVVYIFLNLLNLLFFTFTVKNIKRHSNNFSLVKSGRQGGTDATGPSLFFRISALMGILSFVFENVDICMLVIVMSDGNVSDAIILAFLLLDKTLYFIILVCNTRVLGLLRERFKCKPAKVVLIRTSTVDCTESTA